MRWNKTNKRKKEDTAKRQTLKGWDETKKSENDEKRQNREKRRD